MATPSTPSNFYAQTGNGQNYLSWDIAVGATSYSVQRSLDGVTFTNLASPAANAYLDTAVTLGTQYFYQIASTNASGTSSYTAPQALVPAPSSEMCLGQLRLMAQQRADRVGSQFVTLPEWTTFINLAMYELYNLLIGVSEDYFTQAPIKFTCDGTTFQYPLPDGVKTFQNNSNANIVAAPFYKLMGVDLGINGNNFASLEKFNFADRNQYIYPNSGSSMYGVFNMRYRLVGNTLHLIPTPSASQVVRLWYIPRLAQLLKDTDVTTLGYSGFLNYVICRAAKYALDKEESDTSGLTNELLFLRQSIEESAINRDQGRPDTITDVRSGDFDSGGNNGGFGGGW